ncbi:MAG: HAMP domain-containing sensor histidine kinase [Planctomycetota bacterium]
MSRIPPWRRLSVRVTTLWTLSVLLISTGVNTVMAGLERRGRLGTTQVEDLVLAVQAAERLLHDLDGLRPGAESRAAAASLLAAHGLAYRWCARGGEVLAEGGTTAAADVDLFRFAVLEDGTAAGTFVLRGPYGHRWPPSERAVLARSGPRALTLAPSFEQDVVAATEVSWPWLAQISFTLVFTAMLGLAISFLVTRRLVRLASAAAAVSPDGELPPPFPVAGHDEVALLGNTLNAMRARIHGLIGDLARRDFERRQWIAHVSHDLRTPLTALHLCLDKAERVLSSPVADDQALRAAVTAARLDVDRLAVLVDDLLALARLDFEECRDLETVPLGQVAREAVEALTPIAEAAGVEVGLSVAADVPDVRGDGRLLRRAVENIVHNAVRHARGRVVVEVDWLQRPGVIGVRVSDDGPGVGDAGAAAARPAYAAARPSIGYGLAIAQRVAALHGGDVVGRTHALGGAEFTISVRIESPSIVRPELDSGPAP